MFSVPSGLLELDHMIASSMQDVDEDVSDTEDPDLEVGVDSTPQIYADIFGHRHS